LLSYSAQVTGKDCRKVEKYVTKEDDPEDELKEILSSPVPKSILDYVTASLEEATILPAEEQKALKKALFGKRTKSASTISEIEERMAYFGMEGNTSVPHSQLRGKQVTMPNICTEQVLEPPQFKTICNFLCPRHLHIAN
jgi:hypothetical protein